MKKYLSLIILTLTVSGCASAGNEKVRTETMESVGSKVTKGVTTEAQVKALYGEPSNVSLTDGGSEVWQYDTNIPLLKRQLTSRSSGCLPAAPM